MPKGPMRAHFRPFGMLALAQKAWGEEFEVHVAVEEAAARAPFALVGSMAVVDIQGPLVHHEHWLWDSYDAILARADAAFDCPQAKSVCLRINSPGGDVDGCFDSARALRAMRTKHGKPLVAFADGMIASAAYALACAADKIAVTSTSNVGSIGIIEALCDQTGADAQMGLRYALITSGARKADGNPHAPITEDAIANLQGQVDQMAELFYELVKDLRGLPTEKARALQAGMKIGQRAVSAGLGDFVSTWAMMCQQGDAARSGTGGTSAMKATYLRHMLRSIAEAEGDDISEEEKKHAKRCLKMLDEGGGDEGAPPEKKKDEAEGKKAEGEGEGKKADAKAEGEGKKAESRKAEGEADAKAKAEEKEKEEKEADAKAKAMAAGQSADVVDLARELHTMKVERAAEKEATERATLLAKRPDFGDEIRKTLAKASVAQLREAVETWPRIPGKAISPAAAAAVTGTRGIGQSGNADDVSVAPPEVADHIARKMGASVAGRGIVRERSTLELGVMTPAEAKEFLKKREGGEQAAAGGK